MNADYQYNSILIQKNWRGYATRKKMDSERIKDVINSFLEEKKEHISNIEKRIHPKSDMDFKLLYNEFDQWKELQKADLKNFPCNKDKRTQMKSRQGWKQRQQLERNQLDKEIKILRTIDQLKVSYLQNKKDKRKEKTLHRMTQSFHWKSKRVGGSKYLNHTDTSIEVITPDVAFSRYLVQLYKQLCSDEMIGKLKFSFQ